MEDHLSLWGGICMFVGLVIFVIMGVFSGETAYGFKWAVFIGGPGFIMYVSGCLMESFNSFYRRDETIKEKNKAVELIQSQYEDLSAKLLEWLEKYMSLEETLINVVKERGTENLMALMESYPELKANKSVSEMIEELMKLRKEITVTKKAHNKEVESYNEKTRVFPSRIMRPSSCPTTAEYL